jgi:hypothetical protein
MNSSNYTTTIVVEQSPAEVYNAINNVSSWWQGEIIGNTNKVNDEFTYRMLEFHYSKQRVVELIPNKKIVWDVTESSINFVKQKDEWTGTQIIFEISPKGKQTEILFTHVGLSPSIECYGGCSSGWTQLIHKSLFSLITTGKGVDVF